MKKPSFKVILDLNYGGHIEMISLKFSLGVDELSEHRIKIDHLRQLPRGQIYKSKK